MMEVKSTFEQLLGRQASEDELQALYRIKNTLNIRDNDSIWLILMALESYDLSYRRYPELLERKLDALIEKQKSTINALVQLESKKAVSSLSELIKQTTENSSSEFHGHKKFQYLSCFVLGFFLFGSLCMLVGYVLASGQTPYWLPKTERTLFWTIASALANAPAGWMASIACLTLTGRAAWICRNQILEGKNLGALISLLFFVALTVSLLKAF